MEDLWFVINRELESKTALKTIFFTYSIFLFLRTLLSIIQLEKCRDSVRKTREAYLIERDKTLEPFRYQ